MPDIVLNTGTLLILLETLGLAGIVLTLFWSRRRVGLTPLYVSLGVFQPVQVLLSASIYVEWWPGVPVSPGTLMFAASLLAVLLVFIREDATEARKVIYGIIGANFTMTLVMYAAGVQVSTPGTLNFLHLTPELFSQGARVTAVGTLVFLADVVLLIIAYSAVRHFLPRHPLIRVFMTLAAVLVFDAIAFTTGAFFERENYASLLRAAVISKLAVACLFSLALILYLRFIEPLEFAGAAPNQPLRDFFYAFTYQERFELQAHKTEEAEARLAMAQRVARMGFLDWDLATDGVYWSDEMVRLIGFNTSENQQTMESTLAMIHAGDRDLVRDSLQQARAGIVPRNFDCRMRRPDGATLWLHAESRLIQESVAGGQARLLSTLVDITQRKHAEEERLQVFERITDAFVALDKNWRYTYVNQKAGMMFGREPVELIGKHIWTEFPEGVGQKFHLAYERAMAEQLPAYIEEYYPPYQRWFDNYIYPSPEGLTIYFHDITARKLAEIALQQAKDHAENLLSTANAMIVGLNQAGEVTLFNQAAERITGYTLADLERKNWFETIVPRDRFPQVWEEFKRIVGGGMPRTFENPILTKSGEERIISWQNSEVSEGGRIVGSLSFGIDVTARKRAEDSLRGLLQEKDALLKEVHHRVKNNLQVISSLLRLEAARHANPATRTALGEMQGRVQSMALLHETLYRSGTFAAVDLGNYLKQLATQFFRTLNTQPGDIRLELQLARVAIGMDQAIPCGLLVNELLSNCLKHAFPAGRKGEVRIELTPADGDRRYMLRVSDTGIGLPADFKSRQGNALGLQLVADLAGQLGGALDIGPAPAAVFTITFSADMPNKPVAVA